MTASASNPREPLVSILTPVYNGEPYLGQCIESILNQTYKNWEYVILNNCSKDRSLEIAQSYATGDSRIRVHTTPEFLPQLKNFNFGLNLLSESAGYYKLVLADDWIFPECLDQMVRVAEQHPKVGLVSSYQLAGSKVAGDGLPFPSTMVPGHDACRLQLMHGYFFFGSESSVLIRGEAARSRRPFYNEAALHADTDACYAILRKWDLGFVHQVLTFSRMDNEGISSLTRNLDPNSLDKFIVFLIHGRVFLNEGEFETYYEKFRRRYFRTLARALFFPSGLRRYRFHRKQLASVGFNLSLRRLLPALMYELLDMIFNPKQTLGDCIVAFRNWRAGVTRR